MEYGTYLLALLIAGAGILAVIIVKLLASLCNVCRQRCELFSWTSEVVSGSAVSQYQGETYSQRSVLNHYEEMPQPIFTVASASSSSSAPSLPSFMTPPPYHIAVISDEKPPAYDEIFSQAVS
jgi:hypothetical protein